MSHSIAHGRKLIDLIDKEFNLSDVTLTQEQKDNMLNNRNISQLTNTLYTLRTMRGGKIINSKDEFQDSFAMFINKMNYNSKVVVLVPDEITGDDNELIAKFGVKFNIDDSYVSDEYKGDGCIIYVSDEFYEDIERMAHSILNMEITWNNTRNIGFFHLTLEVDK